MKNTFDEIKTLESLIHNADQMYWKLNNSVVPDSTYDGWMKRLKELDPDNKLITHRGHGKLQEKGFLFKTPLLSLDKAYSIEDVVEWAEYVARDDNEKFTIQTKFDGVSGYYDSENIILASRGDGKVGNIYNHHLEMIDLKIKDSNKIHLGEIVISNETFDNLFKSGIIRKPDGCSLYKNQRNTTAGLLEQLQPTTMHSGFKLLTFIEYENSVTLCYTLKDLKNSEIQANILKVFAAENVEYPTDGIVFKLADKEYAESLGSTEHHPRGQLAFKFANNGVFTKVLDVVWTYGKTAITPNAILKPVELDGVVIKAAKLGSYNKAKELNVKIGSTVYVERRGDVIPTVAHVLNSDDAKPFEVPKHCKHCGEPTQIEGSFLVCPNFYCIGKIVPRMLFAFETLGIEGTGPTRMLQVCKIFNIIHLSDFITEIDYDMVRAAKGLGEAYATTLRNEITRVLCNELDPEKYLTALSVPKVTKAAWKKLLTEYTLEGIPSIDIHNVLDGFTPTVQEGLTKYHHFYSTEINKRITLIKQGIIKGEIK